MQKVTLIFLFSTWALLGNAQMLGPELFIQQVKQNHPIAKQANIQVEKAKAELLSARGAFDPTATLDASRKTFDGKNYYFYTNPEIKLPTRLGGLDIKTGLEENGGQFLNTQITEGQSSYLGVELPVAKGLLMDKRRATLQQAKIFRSQSEQEKLKIINDLLFDAYLGYWQWAGAWQLYNIYAKFLNISNDRLRLVKISFQNGDRSAIDTIEALTQVQNFQMLQADAAVKLNAASLELANFFWDERDSAYELSPRVVPDTISFNLTAPAKSLENLITLSSTNNPSLRSYAYKITALEVERKLKFQNVLPVVNLKANVLNRGYNVMKDVGGTLFQNNYYWGVDVKIPLFLREGRGDYQKAKLKLQETNYELSAKRWEIENKIKTYYTETNLLQKQILVTQNAFNGFNALLRAESLRFQNGESSLFLINTRENKVLETAEKLIGLRIKYLKANYATEWAAGVLR
jgi:outer membrane protein TolC